MGIPIFSGGGVSIFDTADDTPVDGATGKPISSNWAFDHAADFGLHAKVVRKTSDQTLTQSSETLQNVTDMLFAIGANEVWSFNLIVMGNSGATPDTKIGWALPSGATMWWTSMTSSAAENSASTFILPGGSVDRRDWFICMVFNSTTAGNVQLQAAQNTSDASDTKVLTNTSIIAHRIA